MPQQARKSSPSVTHPAVFSRKNSPSTPQTADFGPYFVRRANFFAHRTQPRANFETNNTSAATDAGQYETVGTNARPQTATIETAITSATADAGQRETAGATARPQTATIETGNTTATEKCTKNSFFSPAKAMSVSIGARPARAKVTPVSTDPPHRPAKATPVSRERFPMHTGHCGAWPSSQRAADVTNVVKPTRFTSPREELCDKRRQSKPKNQHFHRKSRWIDDVCNNTHQSTPKSQHDKPDHIGGPENPAAAAAGGGGARPGFNPTHRATHQRPGTTGVEGAGGSGGPGRGAGGWRQGQGGPRDRPLRAAGSRVAISRAGRRPPAHTAAGPQSSTTERPEHQRSRKHHRGPGRPALTPRRRRAPGVPCS